MVRRRIAPSRTMRPRRWPHPSRRGEDAAPQDEGWRVGVAETEWVRARRSLLMVRRRVAPSRTMRPRCGLALRAPQGEVRRAENWEAKMVEGAFLYILRCSDGSFYIGTTRTALEIRIAQHSAGTFGGYTATRRPVTLAFSQWFDNITDAIENERKLKKWSRAKKEAFVRGDFVALQQLSARRSPHSSRRPTATD
jgi:putative endonuclease